MNLQIIRIFPFSGKFDLTFETNVILIIKICNFLILKSQQIYYV